MRFMVFCVAVVHVKRVNPPHFYNHAVLLALAHELISSDYKSIIIMHHAYEEVIIIKF